MGQFPVDQPKTIQGSYYNYLFRGSRGTRRELDSPSLFATSKQVPGLIGARVG